MASMMGLARAAFKRIKLYIKLGAISSGLYLYLPLPLNVRFIDLIFNIPEVIFT